MTLPMLTRPLFTLVALMLSIALPLGASAESPDPLAPASALAPDSSAPSTGASHEVGALAGFADAYLAWDLAAAASVFAPDAEIFHAFGDGQVAHVRGAIRVQDWLAARAFVHPLRWTRAPATGIVLEQLSSRYDDTAGEQVSYVAALLLDADLAPDGTIARLYVAYSPDDLATAIAAATTLPQPSARLAPPAEAITDRTAAESAGSIGAALSSVRIGPERGDYSWVALGSLLLCTSLIARRLAGGQRRRSVGRAPAPA